MPEKRGRSKKDKYVIRGTKKMIGHKMKRLLNQEIDGGGGGKIKTSHNTKIKRKKND